MAEQSPPLRCFLSCSDAPEDISLRRAFEQHCQTLIQQHALTLWSSDHLSPGTIIEEAGEAELRAAHIVFLCLTPDYFTDPRCQCELELALALAHSGQLQIFLLYLRPVNWQHDPHLASLPCWPDSELAVTSYQNHDLAFLHSVRRLSQTLHMSMPIKGSPRRPTIFQARDLPSDLVARPLVYNALKRQLLCDPGSQSFTTAAITTSLRGAGGVGKTTLALSLCHDPELWETFPDGILWLTLGENPPSQLTLVHRLLISLDPDLQERYLSQLLDDAVAQLRHLLENRACLLVLDDVWHASDIARLLEGGSRCARLITTRDDRVLPTTATRHLVDRMQIDEALHLLCRNISPDLLQTPYKTRLETLARRLGYWPLLLSLVNGVLVERIIHYKQPIPDALAMVEEAQKDDGIVAFDIYSDEDRQLAVERNLTMSLHQLATSTHPSWQAIERFQELAIFPEDTDIPLTILQDLWKASGLNAHKTQDLCMLLHRLSLLLTCDLGEGTIRLHDVLRHYLIHRAGDQLPSLHTRLLDISRPTTPHGWIDLPLINHYLWQHLIWHLHAAGHIQEIHTLLTNLHFLTYKVFITDVTALENDIQLGIFSTSQVSTQTSHLKQLFHTVTRISHLLHQVTTLSEIGSLLLCHLDPLFIYSQQRSSLIQNLPLPLLMPWHPLPSHASPSLIRTLRGHNERAVACAISSNGNKIVSGSDDKTIKVWDGETGKELLTLRGHTYFVLGCAISADGSRIVSTAGDKLKIWDGNSGKELLTLQAHKERVSGCAINADGSKIISISSDQMLKIWDGNTGKELLTLHDQKGDINQCGINADGDRIVSVSNDNILKLWDSNTGSSLLTLQGHKSHIAGCAISSNGSRIISASNDGVLKIWDGNTGNELFTLEGHTNRLGGCAINADGSRIVSVSRDNTLNVWDSNMGMERVILQGHTDPVLGCAISADGSKIISTSLNGTVKVWNGNTGREKIKLYGHRDWVHSCAISSDGNKIVSASKDKTLKVWDAHTSKELLTLQGHDDEVVGCAISSNGNRIISTSFDNTTKVWNGNTGKIQMTLRDHTNGIGKCAISPDGNKIVSVSEYKTLKVWNGNTGEELLSLWGHMSGIEGCTISSDGTRIASGSKDWTMRTWDGNTGEELLILEGHRGRVIDCAINVEGNKIVSTSEDKKLKVWDSSTGEELLSLEGHTNCVMGCAISPDNRWIISASLDQTLKLWNAHNGVCILTFPVDGALLDCAFHPDGQHLIACGDQGLYFLQLIL